MRVGVGFSRNWLIIGSIFCLSCALLGPLAAAETPRSLRAVCPQVQLLKGKPLTVARANQLTMTVGTESFAHPLVRILRQTPGIEYGYVLDGCSARAFLGAKALFDQYRIYTARINLDETWPSLSFSTDRTFEGYVEFWANRHSALLTCVQTAAGPVVPYVLDPTFSERALTYPEWIDLLREGQPGSQNVFVSSAFNIDQYSRRQEESFLASDVRCAEETMAAFRGELSRLQRLFGRLPYAARIDSSGEDRRDILADVCLE